MLRNSEINAIKLNCRDVCIIESSSCVVSREHEEHWIRILRTHKYVPSYLLQIPKLNLVTGMGPQSIDLPDLTH